MNKNFFIMGAPNAGKSTYLAALWHSINQKSIATSLTLKKMTGDLQYLYQLEHKWLEIEQLERTVIGQEKMQLILLLTDGECDLNLEFPDLSGETFQNIYETRELTVELYEKISKADVILYFINIENIFQAELISKLPSELRTEENLLESRKPSEHDPTQVQVIDLLQIILEIKREPIQLGIILSAWDLLENNESVNPKKFLEEKMSMLWQFIESNNKKLFTKVWGVSALGGKIEDVDRLLSIEEPINRIKVVNEANMVSQDVTSIISELSGELYDN